MQQLMADLPKERLIPYEPPFTCTGVDFFGPLYVKRGRGSEKVYGCLFTFPGPDNRVRVVEVKTKNDTLVRPISKLCLLGEVA